MIPSIITLYCDGIVASVHCSRPPLVHYHCTGGSPESRIGSFLDRYFGTHNHFCYEFHSLSRSIYASTHVHWHIDAWPRTSFQGLTPEDMSLPRHGETADLRHFANHEQTETCHSGQRTTVVHAAYPSRLGRRRRGQLGIVLYVAQSALILRKMSVTRVRRRIADL